MVAEKGAESHMQRALSWGLLFSYRSCCVVCVVHTHLLGRA